jgi:hypothetical protein
MAGISEKIPHLPGEIWTILVKLPTKAKINPENF